MIAKKGHPFPARRRNPDSPYRHILLATAAIFGILFLGTAGYMLIEGWSMNDAVYMTVITVATVGFREVGPLSHAGQIFTMVLILTGVGAFAFAFGSITELFMYGTIQQYLGRTRMEKELKKVSGHYIICGYGRMGKTISQQFAGRNVQIVVVDHDEAVIRSAQEDGVLAVQGDASHETVLLQAGVDRARSLVCTCSHDAQNILVALTARGLNDTLFIVARAEESVAEKKLKQVGADKVISPYYLSSLRIAQAVMHPATFNFIELSTLDQDFGLSIDELPVGKTSLLNGKTLKESALKDRFDLLVLGIQKNNGSMKFNPPYEAELTAGDRLILMCDQKNLARLAAWAGL